jgi:hypothetical protein
MPLLLVLILLVSATPAAAAEPEPAFCKKEVLHDYLAPLERMPKLRELPYRAREDFRFRGAHLGASGRLLAVSGGSAGYQLQWDANQNWTISVTFARVNSRGKVIRWMGERRFRLSRLAPATIVEPHVVLSGAPATYRTTLVIRSHSGRKLAKFGNYYRVIRPTVHAHLVSDAPAYRPGSTLFARVENPGAAFVLFGAEFFVEKLEGESWIPAPGAPGPFPTGLQYVAPGLTSRHCTIFPIPAALSTGRYRLAQEAAISWSSKKGQLRPMLHAEFDVVP